MSWALIVEKSGIIMYPYNSLFETNEEHLAEGQGDFVLEHFQLLLNWFFHEVASRDVLLSSRCRCTLFHPPINVDQNIMDKVRTTINFVSSQLSRIVKIRYTKYSYT